MIDVLDTLNGLGQQLTYRVSTCKLSCLAAGPVKISNFI